MSVLFFFVFFFLLGGLVAAGAELRLLGRARTVKERRCRLTVKSRMITPRRIA